MTGAAIDRRMGSLNWRCCSRCERLAARLCRARSSLPPGHPCGATDLATASAILHAMDTLRNPCRARPTSHVAPRHGSDLAEDVCVGGPDVLEPQIPRGSLT